MKDEELVLTPGGFRPRSQVQPIEPGHVVRMTREGMLQKVHRATARVVADLGRVQRGTPGEPNLPKNVYFPAPKLAKVPAFGSGWISYAYWSNNSGNAINSFATTWVVPPEPSTQSGQTIFLFNGIQNSSMIYQPVLQFGPSAAGGGNYWAVASWYVDGQGGIANHGPLVRVNVGDVLVGIMTLTGSGPFGFDYDCEFQGLNAGLTIQNVEQLTWACETLEAYGITACSDYPDTQETAFRGINMQTGGSGAPLAWTPVNGVTDCGQSCVVVSNSSSGGEVDIFYGDSAAIVLGGVAPVASNADGRLEVFANGTDHAVWHNWQTAPNNGWSGWASLGGLVTTTAMTGRNADGRLELFARGGDDALWHMWQTAPNNGWSGWASLSGSITSDPSADSNQDGRLEVFARGTDNALWHMWQVAPNSGWSNWDSLGGVVTSLCSVHQNADGRMEVFARGTDNALWHIWQVVPNGGWSGWASLGGVITSDPTVGRNADGRLEAFVRGTDNAVWHIWQTAPNNGWSGWASLGGVITSDIEVANNADGRLEVFARGTDNALWHIWQTAPNNGWSGWSSLGGVVTTDLEAAA